MPPGTHGQDGRATAKKPRLRLLMAHSLYDFSFMMQSEGPALGRLVLRAHGRAKTDSRTGIFQCRKCSIL